VDAVSWLARGMALAGGEVGGARQSLHTVTPQAGNAWRERRSYFRRRVLDM
jgi:hypothetical protein